MPSITDFVALESRKKRLGQCNLNLRLRASEELRQIQVLKKDPFKADKFRPVRKLYCRGLMRTLKMIGIFGNGPRLKNVLKYLGREKTPEKMRHTLICFVRDEMCEGLPGFLSYSDLQEVMAAARQYCEVHHNDRSHDVNLVSDLREFIGDWLHCLFPKKPA